jgi:hypothetical protein
MAYFELENEVDEYQMHADDLKKDQVSLEDWLESDRSMKDLRITNIKQRKGNK